MQRVLIIRFSSFGDIIQALPCVDQIRKSWPSAEIHWLTRHDFADIIKTHPAIDQVWALKKTDGVAGLLKILKSMNELHFTHVYDAHSNLRSMICRIFFFFQSCQIIRRPKNRLNRILLFKFRINRFPKPFRGVQSFLQPLKSWFLVDDELPPPDLRLNSTNLDLQGFPLNEAVALAPSAAWPLKRWPKEHWQKLIQNMPQQKFVLLGGPQDGFCSEIAAIAPARILNLSGKLSWTQTAKILSLCKATVSGDTGVLHMADFQGRPTVAILGPTAFGHPNRKSSVTLSTDLPCQPCSKDGNTVCRNKVEQKCLRDISPDLVQSSLVGQL